MKKLFGRMAKLAILAAVVISVACMSFFLGAARSLRPAAQAE